MQLQSTAKAAIHLVRLYEEDFRADSEVRCGFNFDEVQFSSVVSLRIKRYNLSFYDLITCEIPIPIPIPQNLYGALYKQNSAKGA